MLLSTQIPIANAMDMMLAKPHIEAIARCVYDAPRSNGHSTKIALTGFNANRGTLTCRAWLHVYTPAEKEAQEQQRKENEGKEFTFTKEDLLKKLEDGVKHNDHAFQIVDFEMAICYRKRDFDASAGYSYAPEAHWDVTPFIVDPRVGYGTEYAPMLYHLGEMQRRKAIEKDGNEAPKDLHSIACDYQEWWDNAKPIDILPSRES